MDSEEPLKALWVHDKVVVSPSAIEGSGLHVSDDVAAGTVLLRLAGRLVSSQELTGIFAAALARGDGSYVDSIAVDEDCHLVLPPGSTAHFGNHSCDPNMWHVGPYEIVARRDIAPGDELTIDYGTNSDSADFSMRCRCPSRLCRGVVSGQDWRRAELQDRYRGHWVPALEKRIAADPSRPS